VLEKLVGSGKSTTSATSTNSCSGSTPCCCRAGSYGYCESAAECARIGGECAASALGC
jgi:hypothetical protein